MAEGKFRRLYLEMFPTSLMRAGRAASNSAKAASCSGPFVVEIVTQSSLTRCSKGDEGDGIKIKDARNDGREEYSVNCRRGYLLIAHQSGSALGWWVGRLPISRAGGCIFFRLRLMLLQHLVLPQHLVELEQKGVEFLRIVLDRDLGCQCQQSFSLFPLHREPPSADGHVFSTNNK